MGDFPCVHCLASLETLETGRLARVLGTFHFLYGDRRRPQQSSAQAAWPGLTLRGRALGCRIKSHLCPVLRMTLYYF